MNFDRVAWVYAGLERLVFGQAMHRARRHAARDLAMFGGESPKVVVPGEGDGRLAELLLAAHPGAELEICETSAVMRRRARKRLKGSSRVAWRQSPESADFLVAAYFFDCFASGERRQQMQHWLSLRGLRRVALLDFRPGLRPRLVFGLIEFLMIRFFRVTCGVRVGALPDLDAEMGACGWRRVGHQRFYWGFIEASLWEKAETCA